MPTATPSIAILKYRDEPNGSHIFFGLDFADVKTVMSDKGIAHIGIGNATGDDKAIEAVKQAVQAHFLRQQSRVLHTLLSTYLVI